MGTEFTEICVNSNFSGMFMPYEWIVWVRESMNCKKKMKLLRAAVWRNPNMPKKIAIELWVCVSFG